MLLHKHKTRGTVFHKAAAFTMSYACTRFCNTLQSLRLCERWRETELLCFIKMPWISEKQFSYALLQRFLLISRLGLLWNLLGDCVGRTWRDDHRLDTDLQRVRRTLLTVQILFQSSWCLHSQKIQLRLTQVCSTNSNRLQLTILQNRFNYIFVL